MSYGLNLSRGGPIGEYNGIYKVVFLGDLFKGYATDLIQGSYEFTYQTTPKHKARVWE